MRGVSVRPDVTVICVETGVCDNGLGEVGNGEAHTDEATCNAALDCGAGSDAQCIWTANAVGARMK